MSEVLEKKVYEIVSSVFGVPQGTINAQSSNKSVSNWDSFNIINLMLALESEFEITIDVDEAASLQSVKAILDVLRQKGAL
jgi:acyl carrier protein